ncbi:hypothetical protein Q9L58_004641 [Maublancomyces gigas]|uniref:Uncharacterized protein n=1 Tax=Discina gigas TaxID=1032678 RepID=A0ABR3GKI1_9PEZI
MPYTVESLRTSSKDLQVATLALLILDLHEVIIDANKLRLELDSGTKIHNRKDLQTYLSKAEGRLDEVMIIREVDLALKVWQAGHPYVLLQEIYTLEIKVLDITDQVARWIAASKAVESAVLFFSSDI